MKPLRSQEEINADYDKLTEGLNKKSPIFGYLLIAFNSFFLILTCFGLYITYIQPIFDNFSYIPIRNKYYQIKNYASSHSSGSRGSSGSGGSSGSSWFQIVPKNQVKVINPKIRTYSRDEIKLAVSFGYDSAAVSKLTDQQKTAIKEKLQNKFLDSLK